MKFGVSLPKGKLQNIQKPFELFSLIMETGEPRLSADNLNPLVKLLELADRKDLIVELEGSRETSHAQLTSQHLEGTLLYNLHLYLQEMREDPLPNP